MRLKIKVVAMLGFLALLTPDAHAQVSSRPCPYSCQIAGLSKEVCRDWRQGNTCYVENVRPQRTGGPLVLGESNTGTITAGRPTFGQSTLGQSTTLDAPRMNNPKIGQQPTIPQMPSIPEQGTITSGNGTARDDRTGACRSLRGNYLASPRINIERVQSAGGIFKDSYRINGSIEGVCLVEAGYFEYNRKKRSISVSESRDFNRFNFSVEVNADRNGELRVYNVNGSSDSVSVQQVLSQSVNN